MSDFLFMCLFYMIKISKMTASETFEGTHYVSLSKMPFRCTRSHKPLFL